MAYVKTPVFNFETPELSNEADVPKDLHTVALQVENVIKALAVSNLATAGAGDSGKIIVVSGAGVPQLQPMSGDAGIVSGGLLTIGGEKISTAKLAALCVTEAKIALEAIGTGTLKNLAVTAAKIAAEAIETGKIKNLAVTAAKLAAESVTKEKIEAGLQAELGLTGTLVKTADQELTEESVLQNITGLLVPISASVTERWYVEYLLLIETASNAGDFKVGFTGPAGATFQWGSSMFGPTSIEATPNGLNSIGAQMEMGSGFGKWPLKIFGTTLGGGTAGSLQIKGSHVAATGGKPKILAGSTVLARRTAA